MKIIILILLFPLLLPAQVMTDSTNVISNGNVIRFTTTQQATTYADGDSLRFRCTNLKKIGLVSPLSLPISTATQTALNGKISITDTAGMLTSYLRKAVPLFTNGFGYATGAGGTVTQATSKTTAVTLNKITGRITMNGAALAAGAEAAFTLTNSTISSTDVVIVNVQSVGTAGAYLVSIGAVANGSCSVTVSNASAASLSQAVVLNFAVIKSVIN